MIMVISNSHEESKYTYITKCLECFSKVIKQYENKYEYLITGRKNTRSRVEKTVFTIIKYTQIDEKNQKA